MKELKFFVITDTHYFKYSLGAWGDEYESFMDFEQKCYAETAAINRAVFDYLKSSDEADIVLIAGDLTFNGERESHLEFVELLRELKDAGKAVYVVTAGHDIQPNPFAFDENGRRTVENVKFEELYDLYKDYGYDSAISFNEKYLSYVAQLSDDVRLLVLCNDSPEKRNVAYTDELLDWVKEQAQAAKDAGQMMIAMEHYPVLPGQPVLMLAPDARQKESRRLIDCLADNGVHLIFTGHMHNQSINVAETEKGNKLYDVCTGAIIGWPAFMRLVTIKNKEGAEIKSLPIPDFKWETEGLTCEDYLKRQFERMIRSMIFGMRDDPERILRKFGAGDKKGLYRPVRIIGKALSTWTVGKVARLLWVRADKSMKKEKFVDLAIDIVRCMFEGDQPFVEGTPRGDTVLRVFKRLRPILNIVSKKLHGSQGETIDMYEVLKHSVGNYGISDYNAELVF